MSDDLLVSVIIPVWRDEDVLERALAAIPPDPATEVVVSAVLGDESRYRRIRERHPEARWISAPRGRAVQMNAAAAMARGRWFLFLHADCRLPSDWRDVIASAERRSGVAAGAFRLALDSRDWRARVIEVGVRVRVALLGLPYGDQALFVRRESFEAIGGFRDLPLMEDVDFIRRVRKAGRLLRARAAVVASPRRWERDGWFVRSSRNIVLATRFLLGAPAAQLAQRYLHRYRSAAVMMARAPWTGGKTRLRDAGDTAALDDLRQALFLDTLDVLTTIRQVEHIVACEPVDACDGMRDLTRGRADVIAQRGAGLGERLQHAFEDVFRLGAELVVVIGSDLPDLPPRLLEEAFAALRGRGDRVVLGPAADGGYYLVGLKQAHPELFAGIEWSTNRVLDQTLRAARDGGMDVVLLSTWADVDSREDLERLAGAQGAPSAPRTRAWMARR